MIYFVSPKLHSPPLWDMLELTLYVSIAISAYLGYVVTIQNLLLAKAVIETLKVPPFADSLRLFTFWFLWAEWLWET